MFIYQTVSLLAISCYLTDSVINNIPTPVKPKWAITEDLLAAMVVSDLQQTQIFLLKAMMGSGTLPQALGHWLLEREVNYWVLPTWRFHLNNICVQQISLFA